MAKPESLTVYAKCPTEQKGHTNAEVKVQALEYYNAITEAVRSPEVPTSRTCKKCHAALIFNVCVGSYQLTPGQSIEVPA